MFSNEVLIAAKLHAKREYPKESCGVVINNKYEPCKNISSTPNIDFEIPIQIHSNFELIQSVIHSHTKTNWPSKKDMEKQIVSGKPWGIVFVPNGIPLEIFFFGDQVVKPPLLGREFRWGVTDCFSLGRDFYFERFKIRLKEIPRERGCFDNKEDLFGQYFEEMGFIEIDHPTREGDGMTFVMGTPVPNHCAIMDNSSHIIHQPLNGVSRRALLASWESKVCKIHKAYRHKDLL